MLSFSYLICYDSFNIANLCVVSTFYFWCHFLSPFWTIMTTMMSICFWNCSPILFLHVYLHWNIYTEWMRVKCKLHQTRIFFLYFRKKLFLKVSRTLFWKELTLSLQISPSTHRNIKQSHIFFVSLSNQFPLPLHVLSPKPVKLQFSIFTHFPPRVTQLPNLIEKSYATFSILCIVHTKNEKSCLTL